MGVLEPYKHPRVFVNKNICDTPIVPWHLYFHMICFPFPCELRTPPYLLCSECHHAPQTLLGCHSTGVMQLGCNWAAANPWEAAGMLSANGSEQTNGWLFPLTGNRFVLIWAIIHAMTHIKDIGADASHYQAPDSWWDDFVYHVILEKSNIRSLFAKISCENQSIVLFFLWLGFFFKKED